MLSSSSRKSTSCVFSQVYIEVSSDTLLFLPDGINQQVQCRIESYREPRGNTVYPLLDKHALCSSPSQVALVMSTLSWLFFLCRVYIPDDGRAQVDLLVLNKGIWCIGCHWAGCLLHLHFNLFKATCSAFKLFFLAVCVLSGHQTHDFSAAKANLYDLNFYADRKRYFVGMLDLLSAISDFTLSYRHDNKTRNH